MNTKLFITVIALAGSFALFASDADAKRPDVVDCDSGGSIQAALDKEVGHSGPVTINVRGTCEEHVFIGRDDVAINGNNEATVIGTLEIRGSSRINIANITVTGPGFGVFALNSRVSLDNVNATQNEEFAAVLANESSSLSIGNSNISNNQGTGVYVGLSASVVVGGNTVINHNPGVGVQVQLGSSALLWDGTSIEGNGQGVAAQHHSSVLLENTNVSNNTTNGIDIEQDGGVVLRGSNTINGNGGSGVFCHDTESSYQNIGAPITDPINCSGFN